MLEERCLRCERLGKSCNGSNFINMTASELLEWCKTRKKILNLTNEEISEMSFVPVGTINRLFSGKNPDFRYETVHPIAKALISKEWQEYECGQLLSDRIRELEEKNKKLEEENRELCKYIARTKKNTTHKRNNIIMAVAYFAPWILFITVWLFSK